MRTLKISIITPSLNQGEFLEQTIDSVLSQNYPKLEYIIIDGGSTDNSVEIIKKHEKYLKYWISEPDSGQSDAINKGFKHVTGELCNWINSDDYYYQDAFEFINDQFSQHDPDVLCGISRIFNNNGETRFTTGSYIDFNNLYKTIGKARIDQPPTFFKTKIFHKLMPLSDNLHFLMDRELWLKYLIQFGLEKVYKTNKPLVNFRHHNSSKSVSLIDKFNTERESIFYDLIKNEDLSIVGNFIKRNFEINDKIHLDVSNKISKDVLIKSIQYYLLQLIEEAYWNKNYRRMIELTDLVDIGKLKLQDKLFLRSLMIKMKVRKLLKLNK